MALMHDDHPLSRLDMSGEEAAAADVVEELG